MVLGLVKVKKFNTSLILNTMHALLQYKYIRYTILIIYNNNKLLSHHYLSICIIIVYINYIFINSWSIISSISV